MKPIAVVLASAECASDDFAEFRDAHRGPFDVFAVNDAGWIYPGDIEAWCTLHPEMWPEWIAKRTLRHGEVGAYYTSISKNQRVPDGIEFREVGHWGAGSSSLFAVTVALSLGYSRILLCGVPMDSRPHAPGAGTWDGESWPDREVAIHREGWEFHKGRLGGVRSMSGWTAELLGEPDDLFLIDRTDTHATMAGKTVIPPTNDNGLVREAFWHCPCCGDTQIHRLQIEGSVYHCASCGRDFRVWVDPVPWWRRTAQAIRDVYPVNLRGAK